MTKPAKTDLWMPLYIADYLADTTHLSTEQHGAYLLLLMSAWKRGGDLPGDPDQLAAVARMSPKAWAKNAPVLTAFFSPIVGGWRHGRVVQEIEKARKNSERRSKAGATGAATRWQTDGKRIGKRGDKPTATGWQNDGPTPSPSPEDSGQEVSPLVEGCTTPARRAGVGGRP